MEKILISQKETLKFSFDRYYREAGINPVKSSKRRYIMNRFLERLLMVIFDLTEVDVKNIRESDGPWDAQNEAFIPSDRPLHQILRSMIEHFVGLQKPQIQTGE